MAEVINPHINPLFHDPSEQGFFKRPGLDPFITPTAPQTLPNLDVTEIAIKQECDRLAALLISKRRDYGKGNIAEFGTLGILVRISDKYNRLKNLTDNGKNGEVNEPIQDTWQDLAGYSVIGKLVSEGKW